MRKELICERYYVNVTNNLKKNGVLLGSFLLVKSPII